MRYFLLLIPLVCMCFAVQQKCEPITCRHDTDDLRFVDARIKDVQPCEFTFESRRRVGVLQIAPDMGTVETRDQVTWTKRSYKIKAEEIGTILYCSACNTALAVKIYVQ